jgi:hypothetical protein
VPLPYKFRARCRPPEGSPWIAYSIGLGGCDRYHGIRSGELGPPRVNGNPAANTSNGCHSAPGTKENYLCVNFKYFTDLPRRLSSTSRELSRLTEAWVYGCFRVVQSNKTMYPQDLFDRGGSCLLFNHTLSPIFPSPTSAFPPRGPPGLLLPACLHGSRLSASVFCISTLLNYHDPCRNTQQTVHSYCYRWSKGEEMGRFHPQPHYRYLTTFLQIIRSLTFALWKSGKHPKDRRPISDATTSPPSLSAALPSPKLEDATKTTKPGQLIHDDLPSET